MEINPISKRKCSTCKRLKLECKGSCYKKTETTIEKEISSDKRVWVKMLQPYGYHDNHIEGDIIFIDNKNDVDYCIENGIAEVVNMEDELQY